MKLIPLAAALALLAFGASARAEVRQVAADGFFIAHPIPVAATPAKTYAAVAAMPIWWSSEHTWSGKSANLGLKAEAGGCFCERWPGGSAEHGRVLMALPDQLLRIETALGPLQELALKGILSFWIRVGDDGSVRVEVEYRVNGSSASGLEALAPQVDEMLGLQVARLKHYIETGRPDEPAPVALDPQPDAIRAALLEGWKREAEAAKGSAAKPTKTKPAKRDPAAKP